MTRRSIPTSPVEVDPAVVNLGVYETFFQEKRPFFVEGSEIFSFGADGTSGGQLFYSRRIGREPSLSPPPPNRRPQCDDDPRSSEALRKGSWLVPRRARGCTDKETARFRTPDGADRGMIVEPLSNYFVGRARRGMRDGRTFVGSIVSAVNRRLDTDAFGNTSPICLRGGTGLSARDR
jgi:hypothetical protein